MRGLSIALQFYEHSALPQWSKSPEVLSNYRQALKSWQMECT